MFDGVRIDEKTRSQILHPIDTQNTNQHTDELFVKSSNNYNTPPRISIMASAAIQAQANALNAKMEGEASKMLDEIERSWMRKVARQSFACAVKCYDKAGTSGPAESLESCTRNCQAPYQQSSNLVQQVRRTDDTVYDRNGCGAVASCWNHEMALRMNVNLLQKKIVVLGTEMQFSPPYVSFE